MPRGSQLWRVYLQRHLAQLFFLPFLLSLLSFPSTHRRTHLRTPPCSKLSPPERRAYYPQQLLPSAPLLERHVWYRCCLIFLIVCVILTTMIRRKGASKRASTRLNSTTYILYFTHQTAGNLSAIGTCFTSILRHALRR